MSKFIDIKSMNCNLYIEESLWCKNGTGSFQLYYSIDCTIYHKIIGPVHSWLHLNSPGSIQSDYSLVDRADQYYNAITALTVPCCLFLWYEGIVPKPSTMTDSVRIRTHDCLTNTIHTSIHDNVYTIGVHINHSLRLSIHLYTSGIWWGR